MKSIGKALCICLALATSPLASAQAADDVDVRDVRVLGAYSNWVAYTFLENGKKVCYMASSPVKEEGKYRVRGDVYAVITHRPWNNNVNEVSLIAGYNFRKNSIVESRVGDNAFVLYAHKDTAWNKEEKDDDAMVEKMRSGNKMIVVGTSSRGTRTTDTYSLMGFTKAHDVISKECDVRIKN
ncbi:MAG: hypothetical protein GY804_12270 [Alphaproteobacteria bacterium]|nr:hypothetical protein [Alphaproteobacteria bacterium]